ncbi:MAG: phage portal protein [Saprospiraceae bacterium]|nr:phage portal protein [Pyrinomonadaceae bacterium]
MNTNIEQAIENLRVNQGRYAKTERYHRGEHNLMFATEKFQNTFGSLFREFAMNLCPAICDAVKDKLKITEFRVESGRNDLASKAERIWQRNRMATRAGEVHKEALKNGDAYAIVWPNAGGQPMIFPNKAASVTVIYDDESPGKVLWAAKYWRTHDKRTRLNLFYPDRIERYINTRESDRTLPDAKDFLPFRDEEIEISNLQNISASPQHSLSVSDSMIPNPYGVVPVFHFANNADIGLPGQSELESAIPVQDGLNKSVLDMLVAMEFSAYRQRWAAGIEIEYDNEGKAVAPFTAGIDHLWIAQNPHARFGDFEAANLDHFLKVKDSFRVDMASVTGTPLHYLMPHTNRSQSGESLKKAETRFIAKVRDRQESFGQTWADLMAFALRVEGHGNDIRLITAWEDAARISEREVLENIILKKEIGISAEQALAEAGYGDVDVAKMLK